MNTNFKKSILIDLDGVLNTYTGDFDENYIPPIKEGAFEFLKKLSEKYDIKIFTSRKLSLVSEWVKENIAIEPILIEDTKEYKEYIVGKTDLMYYETHRIEMEKHAKYEGNNNNQFTVLTVVDGEQIKVYSKSNPEFCYTASFLDIVTIPSTIQDYVVEADGYQPVVVHKTILREGYSRYKNNDYWNR